VAIAVDDADETAGCIARETVVVVVVVVVEVHEEVVTVSVGEPSDGGMQMNLDARNDTEVVTVSDDEVVTVSDDEVVTVSDDEVVNANAHRKMHGGL
jgi:hypothetical protein